MTICRFMCEFGQACRRHGPKFGLDQSSNVAGASFLRNYITTLP